MNNAVTAPALNPTRTSAVVASRLSTCGCLGQAGPKLIMARSTSKLHQDAGYMSELRFRSLNSLDGGEASIHVLVIHVLAISARPESANPRPGTGGAGRSTAPSPGRSSREDMHRSSSDFVRELIRVPVEAASACDASSPCQRTHPRPIAMRAARIERCSGSTACPVATPGSCVRSP